MVTVSLYEPIGTTVIERYAADNDALGAIDNRAEVYAGRRSHLVRTEIESPRGRSDCAVYPAVIDDRSCYGRRRQLRAGSRRGFAAEKRHQ